MGTPPRWPPRPAVWSSALFIAAFQVAGSFGAAHNQSDRKAIDVAALVLVLLGPVALLVRERWPLVAVAVSMAAADVYIAFGYPYGPIFISVVVAIFAAAQAGSRRALWAATAVGAAGFVVAGMVDPSADGGVAWVALAAMAGWLAVVFAVAEVVRIRTVQARERAQAGADEAERHEGEQRLALAQELHDVLAHNISLINVQASVALHLIDEQPEAARPALAHIKAASHEALGELRSALDVLRRGDDAPRAPAPRLAQLDALVAGVRAGGLDVTLDQEQPRATLPAAVELAAYRIVQEALTNVTRHARATSATVRLRHDGGVDLEVVDDGIGGLPTPGNGLDGMGERAASVGGTVEAGPAPGGGFRVVAHLPLVTP